MEAEQNIKSLVACPAGGSTKLIVGICAREDRGLKERLKLLLVLYAVYTTEKNGCTVDYASSWLYSRDAGRQMIERAKWQVGGQARG